MARINIEESLFKDLRFTKLLIKTGSRHIALGLLVEAWIVAQEYWKNSHNGIPKPIWMKEELSQLLIDCCFAEDRGEFVYMKGSVDHFAWLTQRIEAGRIGGSHQRNHSEKSEATAKRPQAVVKPPNLTLPPPLPLSLSLSQEKTKNKAKTKATSEVASPSLGSQIWNAYRDAYQQRYQTDPVRNATTNSQAANLGKRLGEEAIEVVRFYLKHNDGYYLRNQHPIALCLAQAEGIHTQWKRNRAVTSVQVKQFENASHFDELRAMVDRGEL